MSSLPCLCVKRSVESAMPSRVSGMVVNLSDQKSVERKACRNSSIGEQIYNTQHLGVRDRKSVWLQVIPNNRPGWRHGVLDVSYDEIDFVGVSV